jgi:hypothetical protein
MSQPARPLEVHILDRRRRREHRGGRDRHREFGDALVGAVDAAGVDLNRRIQRKDNCTSPRLFSLHDVSAGWERATLHRTGVLQDYWFTWGNY